uniref:DUF6534 domain-containing protein n=1 Tax=Moniliophthora roreri TaxID=221103 RepID=A0A0W0F0W8_MONRR
MGDFDMVVGTYLLGIFVNTFLFGLVCYQFLVYKNTKFNDPTWIKSVVAALFFIDVIHSIVEVYGAWEMCVTNYANPPSLFFVSWVIPFTAATTAVAALITQAFLCHRVRGLTKNNILTGLIGLLSVVGCVFGITAGIKSGIIREVAKFGPLAPFVIRKLYFDVFDPLQNTEAFPEVWLSFQTAADVLITAALTVVLYRSRTGFRRTDSIINRLIRGAIQTASAPENKAVKMGDYDMVVGTYLLGIIVNTFLFGLVCYQFLVYKTTEFNDPTWIKTIIAALFLIDLLHSVVEIYGAWEMCVTNYANPGSLQFVSWVIPFTAATTAVAALIAQIFLGHRLAFQTAADLLITASLTIVLSRSRTGFRRTDSIINRLIRGAIQTGFFVSIFALGDLFSFLFLEQTNWYAFFAFPIGRIYTNTMLDTLNSRRTIKQTVSSTYDVDTESDGAAFRMNTQGFTTFNTITVTKDTPDGD